MFVSLGLKYVKFPENVGTKSAHEVELRSRVSTWTPETLDAEGDFQYQADLLS